uniref:(northern house mosquito) hypothetical protein n=1 Tax=Culex pipiens TaxID=7175 RepID=A0A8D8EXY1_CULPI
MEWPIFSAIVLLTSNSDLIPPQTLRIPSMTLLKLQLRPTTSSFISTCSTFSCSTRVSALFSTSSRIVFKMARFLQYNSKFAGYGSGSFPDPGSRTPFLTLSIALQYWEPFWTVDCHFLNSSRNFATASDTREAPTVLPEGDAGVRGDCRRFFERFRRSGVADILLFRNKIEC